MAHKIKTLIPYESFENHSAKTNWKTEYFSCTSIIHIRHNLIKCILPSSLLNSPSMMASFGMGSMFLYFEHAGGINRKYTYN